jgi:hypothetical protein
VSEISAAEILVPLRKIKAKGNYDTARRVRSTIGQISATLSSPLAPIMSPLSVYKAPYDTDSITPRRDYRQGGFGGLLRAISAYEGMPETRIALQLMALLYPRPGALRQRRGGK